VIVGDVPNPETMVGFVPEMTMIPSTCKEVLAFKVVNVPAAGVVPPITELSIVEPTMVSEVRGGEK